jgi:hypothetical protein
LDRATFEAIPYGAAVNQSRRLTNPRAGLAFDLEGPDAQAVTAPPPPRIDQLRTAGDMAELYWMALLRDTNYDQYAGNALAQESSNSLAAFPGFTGPTTPQQLSEAVSLAIKSAATFHNSCCWLLDVPYCPFLIPQRRPTAQAGSDFLDTRPPFLDNQNGEQPGQALPVAAGPFYIRNSPRPGIRRQDRCQLSVLPLRRSDPTATPTTRSQQCTSVPQRPDRLGQSVLSARTSTSAGGWIRDVWQLAPAKPTCRGCDPRTEGDVVSEVVRTSATSAGSTWWAD